MKALAMVALNRICKSGIQFKRNNMFPMFIYKQNNKEIIKKDIKEEIKKFIFDIVKKI